MTVPNKFEKYMSEMPQDHITKQSEFIPSCENVHPHVEDAIEVMFEDCDKISEDDSVLALNTMLGPARLQMINCLTQEFLIMYDALLLDWEDMANQALSAMPDSGLTEEEEIALIEENHDPLAEDGPDETPVLVPYHELEAMLKQCLKMAFFVMPEVVQVIDGH